MEIGSWDDDRLLKTEAGSRSSFYGLRSVIETLVWLHYCLDRYYFLLCCEWLGHSWYVVVMWFVLANRVSNTLFIQCWYDCYSMLITYAWLNSIHVDWLWSMNKLLEILDVLWLAGGQFGQWETEENDKLVAEDLSWSWRINPNSSEGIRKL
jgi:hypothetical protein